MAVKLAVEHVEETRTASRGLITDATDAVAVMLPQLADLLLTGAS
jgi:hypothetical protein